MSFAARYGAAIQWFPGHMAKASNQIAARAKLADVVIEVRDARLPQSSASAMLGFPELAHKPRIVMFNKADLASDALRKSVLEAMKEREPHVTCLFASNQASGRTNAKAVLALVDKMPTRGRQFREAGTMMLVIGMSNVGKSSIINSLRNAAGGVREGKGAKTGAAPGITRSVSALCVRQSPPVYVYDTPGVVAPHVSSVDHGMKLLLCNILPEKIAPYAVQAEFLLHFFAQIGAKKWADVLGLRSAYGPDDASVCLAEVATKLQMLKPGGGPDLEAAGRHIVRHFQKGLLGKYTLDVSSTIKPQPLLEDVVIC